MVRTRSLSVPLDTAAVQDALASTRAPPFLGRTARRLGTRWRAELAAGGKTPLWDALGRMTSRARGSSTPPADAVVVVRSAKPQQGATKASSSAVRRPRASGEPGRDRGAGASPSAIPAFARGLRHRLDRHRSRGAGLVLLLGGPQPGTTARGRLPRTACSSDPSVAPRRVRELRLLTCSSPRGTRSGGSATVEHCGGCFPMPRSSIATTARATGTAAAAEQAGARMIRLVRHGKEQRGTDTRRARTKKIIRGPSSCVIPDLRGGVCRPAWRRKRRRRCDRRVTCSTRQDEGIRIAKNDARPGLNELHCSRSPVGESRSRASASLIRRAPERNREPDSR